MVLPGQDAWIVMLETGVSADQEAPGMTWSPSASRRQNVGSLADSEEVLPNGTARKRTVQHRSGAPGWNRTSDTGLRKHAEGVTGSGPQCAIVLHGPSFGDGLVLSGVQAC